MKLSNVDEDCEVDGVPVSAVFSEDRRNRYGSVPGLDEEELATPQELERQAFLEEWGPVLALPRRERSPIRPVIDEYFGVDWGAFATADFDRNRPAFDKARFKAQKLREELRNVLLMLELVSRRLPRAKARVLKYLRIGVIELEHIASDDMLAMARFYLRARRIQGEIRQLGLASHAKRRRALAAVLG